ncbi:Gp51 [Mycolicibacterium canariasense]|uniref:Gp51 n=1 Tax=Mycolicibacterium canariasense TaxID=228230 RepID=A0A100WHW3_MYCCR|nr:HNH endonuclease [Mycolicibacterium canariasense]GAS98917.1 Gp51 [Mycolicibacterium canariasense]
MTPEVEEWRPVVGYEGLYEVSSEGRVRSLDRWLPYTKGAGGMRFHKGCVISPFRSSPTNYLTVSLGKDGCKRNRRIHVLVLEAFVGPRPTPDMDGCHTNGDQDDNRPCNLRWDTKSANMQDCLLAGDHPQASKTHCKRGHEFSPENTYINPTSGGRQCKTCVRDARRAKKQRSRGPACSHSPG